MHVRGFFRRHPGWLGLIAFLLVFLAFVISQSFQTLEAG
jgi:hypothetical protein